MCGIAGVVAVAGELHPGIRAALPAMTDALRHRGPDGDGVFVDEYAALGHRRLAIIDRAGGDQPLTNEDHSLWIVFNGEIYNHHSLRRRLTDLGHVFKTRSDTEAIVHAYEQYGTACVDYLEGMFAFALYDRRTRDLFIARDRLGKKPLFYAVLGGALHFASEIKAIRESPALDATPDLDQLEGYLSLGYFVAPGTAYRHVRALEPGHWLRMHDGAIETRQYWDVEDFDSFDGDEPEALELIREQLAARVDERLESEVPLGAFLSGGIDSGLVVSYMRDSHEADVLTTSVGFGEAAHNELALASETARYCRTRHYTHVIAPALPDVLQPIADAFDEPFADSSSIPTYYVSREARRHVTVALSGDGGDESFAGYDFRYRPHAVESALRGALPRWMRRVAGAAGAAWPRSAAMPRALRLGTFLENVGRDPEAAYFSDLCFFKPHATRRLMGRAPSRDPRSSAVFDAVTAPYRRCTSDDPVQRAEYADLKIYLPNDVLTKVDRMSMQHSLEVRCPLLDRRVVELAFRLPQRVKRGARRGKHLLKQVARDRLPDALTRAPKHGFSAPIGEWIAGPYRHAFAEDVLRPGSGIAALVDVREARRLFDAHLARRADHSYVLWALWMLERWASSTGPARRPAPVPDPVRAALT